MNAFYNITRYIKFITSVVPSWLRKHFHTLSPDRRQQQDWFGRFYFQSPLPVSVRLSHYFPRVAAGGKRWSAKKKKTKTVETGAPWRQQSIIQSTQITKNNHNKKNNNRSKKASSRNLNDMDTDLILNWENKSMLFGHEIPQVGAPFGPD